MTNRALAKFNKLPSWAVVILCALGVLAIVGLTVDCVLAAYTVGWLP